MLIKKQIAPLKQKNCSIGGIFLDKWLLIQQEDLLVKEW